jgi:hypothetical protein
MPVRDYAPAEIVLALALLLVPFGLAVLGMIAGYRRSRRRDEVEFGPLATTDPPDRAPDGHALYTATTHHGSRMRRVAAGGLLARGACRWWLDDNRLVFQRTPGPAVAITDVRGTGLTGAHAGRAVGRGRIAVVTWAWGAALVDTGFAFPTAAEAEAFGAAVAALTPTGRAQEDAGERA